MWVQADGQTHGGCVAPRAKAWDEYLRCEGKRDEKEKRKEKEKEITEKKTCSLFFTRKKKLLFSIFFFFLPLFLSFLHNPIRQVSLSLHNSLLPQTPQAPALSFLFPFFPNEE